LKPKIRRRLAATGLLLIVLVASFHLFVPDLVAARYNTVAGSAGPVNEAALRLHKTLRVADLHTDALLWSRDLLVRSDEGHLDLPRLLDGGVGLQVFSAVNQVPFGLNLERSRADGFDQLALLTLAQGWPPRTWGSSLQRVLYQAERLTVLGHNSQGRLRIATSAGALPRAMSEKGANSTVVAVLAIEGGQALEGELANLERLYAAGYRMLGLVHFLDNQIGGSAHGVAKGGLTEFGARVVQRMEALGMAVDLAHASESLMRDVARVATRPLVVSHTGVRGTCDNTRNLSDEMLNLVASTGGLIGIGFWSTAVCGDDARAIARAFHYAAGRIGVEHLALGSDFDGAVTTPFDAAGLPILTEALLAAGFDAEEVSAIMGDNALRVLRTLLPER
jgi:microsomal dipeptidase-like Zn-dependent dipeptidase